MFVLEMADYVFTGSDRKPLAVVELSEGIKRGREMQPRQLRDDDCWPHGRDGERALTAVSQIQLPWRQSKLANLTSTFRGKQ